MKHRLVGESSLALDGESTDDGIPVIVTISPEGLVTSARVQRSENDERADPSAALAAARRWKFRPFSYRGEPVAAQGILTIGYRPRERWRHPAARLPDYSNLKISLARSACYGTCPDYLVTLDGDGTVVFSTRRYPWDGAAESQAKFNSARAVLLPGEHRARIDRATLDGLIERFRAAHFFGLEPEYRAKITDNPEYVLKFETGGRSWTVTDYVGREVGMPSVVSALEDAVDAAAGTARWVSGDENSVAALRAENFDFTSPRAAELAAFAALASDAPDVMLLGLVEAGVSLDQPFLFDSGDQAAPLGETLLLAAIRKHRLKLFEHLARHGWLERLSQRQLSQAFAESGGGCDPGIATALVRAGADPAARAQLSGGLRKEPGSTALIAAVADYGPCYRVDLEPVVAALVTLGVDVNAADEAGQTALYGIADPDLLDQLLAAGARADVRDKKGNSPVFSSWTDRIVFGLLEAGANPRGRYSDGKTLRQSARDRMPSVLAWLDAHGVD